MPTTTYIREDQAIIHVGVNGINMPSTFSWATYQGGDVEAEDTFTRPGGLQPGVNLGGPSKRTDVTVTRQFTPALHTLVVKLENLCGKAAAHASYTPLDADGNPNGTTVTVKGILKSVVKPNWDANQANAAFLGIVIGLDQQATAS